MDMDLDEHDGDVDSQLSDAGALGRSTGSACVELGLRGRGARDVMGPTAATERQHREDFRRIRAQHYRMDGAVFLGKAPTDEDDEEEDEEDARKDQQLAKSKSKK